MKRLFYILFVLFLLTSCKEENYYTVEPVNPVEPTVKWEGNWLRDVKSLGYFGEVYNFVDNLMPSFLLHVNGMKMMHPNSEFVQRYFSDDLQLTLRNPGPGVKISVTLRDSEITGSFTHSFTVTEDLANRETLDFYYPVLWNYSTLAAWEKEQTVNLVFDVAFDGQFVESYVKKMNCYSVRDYIYGVSLAFDNAEKHEMYKPLMSLMDDYFALMDDESLFLSTYELLTGYIDDTTPIIETLKKEAIDDGFLKMFYTYSDETVIEAIGAFAYLMQKHNIQNSPRGDSDFGYMCTFDEVFSLEHGCYDALSCAFASWCVSLGIDVSLLFMNYSDILPIINLPSGTQYPWDPSILCFYGTEYPDLSVPSEEGFAQAVEFFEKTHKTSVDKLNYAEAGGIKPCLMNVRDTKRYIPTFNIQRYTGIGTRSMENKQMRLITK